MTRHNLRAGLEAFWEFENALDLGHDSHGASSLVNNNAVTQAAGLVGFAAGFASASSQSLSGADSAALSMGGSDDLTLGAWVRLDALPAGRAGIVTKWHATASLAEYGLFVDGATSRFSFAAGNGTSTAEAVASTFGAPALATWYFLVGRFHQRDGLLSISVNSGPLDTVALASGLLDGANEFRIGRDEGAGYLGGRVDSVGLWRRLLPDGQVSLLYDAGRGRSYERLIT